MVFLNALKFMVLIPIHPMRFIREFEFIPKQKGVVWLTFLISLTLLITGYYLFADAHRNDVDFYLPGMIITSIFIKIFSLLLFGLTLLIVGFAFGLELAPQRIFALMAFTLFLDVFPVFTAVWDLNIASYVLWIFMFLKIFVISIGVFIFGDDTISKSVIAASLSSLWLIFGNDIFYLN